MICVMNEIGNLLPLSEESGRITQDQKKKYSTIGNFCESVTISHFTLKNFLILPCPHLKIYLVPSLSKLNPIKQKNYFLHVSVQ